MERILDGIKQAEPLSTNSVSFCPASYTPESFKKNDGLRVRPGEDPPLTLLRAVARKQSQICVELLHSSLPPNPDAIQDIIPQSNGFVHTVIEAYNKHRALIIRPDDVWLAILTQFCFFVNGNAEALRSVFVAHEGKRELVITSQGNRHSMDPANMAHQMTELMQSHIVDESLREWIMPSFTTTTATDSATSAIVMMGTMKEYFSFAFSLMCGIPKVMLEGEKRDWEDILRRLERLKKYGVQTIAWYHLLRPVISRFVGTYDNPTSAENLDFWNKMFVAGSIGSHISSTSKTDIFPEGTRDTVRPIPGWWYFIKGKEAEPSESGSSDSEPADHGDNSSLVHPTPPARATETKENGRFFHRGVIPRVKSLFDTLRRKY